MKILITGAAGWTAQAIIQALHTAGHQLYGFDIAGQPYATHIAQMLTGQFAGSVADTEQVMQAMKGMDAVVHLAVTVGEGDYTTPDLPFNVNVKGTYNICHAAHTHNIQHLILMSEAAVHLPPEDGVIKANDLLHTAHTDLGEHLYDLTKSLQEHIVRNYVITFGLNVTVLRPGHIVDSRTQLDPHGRPLAQVHYLRGGWVCRYDLATAVVRALNVAQTGYTAYHVVGAEPCRTLFDVARTERELVMTVLARFEDYPIA